jgi:oxalate---CoA ligase
MHRLILGSSDMSKESAPAAVADLLRGGDAPAIVVPETNDVTTHEQLAAHVELMAGRLAHAGVGRGDLVAFVLTQGSEIIELLLGAAVVGAATAPLNPAYTRHEFDFYLNDLQPRLLVLPAGGAEAARRASSGLQVVDLVANPGSAPVLYKGTREVGVRAPAETGGADDVVLVLHTSGTTSRPKQVPLSQRNIMASTSTVAEHYRLGSDDVSYCAMPLFHIHGLVASTLAPLISGGSVVIPHRLAPTRFWKQARGAGITWLSAGPTIHQMLLEQANREHGLSSLRFVRSCSSALAPTLMSRAEETYGVAMLEAYGMTEASHQMSSNPLPPAPRRAGSVGVPTGTEICIADPSGRFVPEGESGEVAIRGPSVMLGYRGDTDANATAFFDGWFRTGDRGVLEDGYLRLEGRLKELIIRGGENISPAEVEDVLKTHSAVSDAACFGVPDEKYGEVVAAAISLTGEATEQELLDHCRERLSAFKVPKQLFFVPQVPRTPTGKLQRRRIGETLLEHGS